MTRTEVIEMLKKEREVFEEKISKVESEITEIPKSKVSGYWLGPVLQHKWSLQHVRHSIDDRIDSLCQINGLIFCGFSMGIPGYVQCVGLDFVNGMCEKISLASYNNDPSIYHNICIDSVRSKDFAGLRFDFDIQNIEKTIQINSPSTIRLISTTGESVEIPFMVRPAHEGAHLSKLPIGEINLMILEFNKPISRFTLRYKSGDITTDN
ncbi:MAG: hypothetical protein HXN09_06065 [Porphyromonadaceae bacterium]|nr:hypothetical protein [Porphyromonadaceae bacterium]